MEMRQMGGDGYCSDRINKGTLVEIDFFEGNPK
jgi:hypothetical protein